MKLRDVNKQIAQEIARARRALSIERAAPLMVAPVAFACLWAAVAVAGGQAALGPFAASLSAIAATIAVVLLALRGGRAYRAPSAAQARARLERDCALEAGSLDAAEDKPSTLDPSSLTLWRRAQEQARLRLASARARPPRPDFSSADRWRLRYLAPLVLAASIASAWETAPQRLAAAFAPDIGPLVGDKPLVLQAWLTPAEYTGAGLVTLPDDGGAVTTPPIQEAVARAAGPVGPPRLRFRGEDGAREIAFARTADGAWEARLPISEAGVLEVRRFGVKARWRIAPAPDGAPVARFVNDVRLDGEELVFAWEAQDDFGVRAVFLELEPASPPPGLADAPPSRTPIAAPTGEPKDASDSVTLNLAAHAYAGLEVDARIVARDAAGGEGASAPIRIVLPKPTFLQPLAQAAIEARREILWEARPYRRPPRFAFGRDAQFWAPDTLLGRHALPMDNAFDGLRRAPPGYMRAAQLIDALTTEPQDGYFEDLSVYLGFRGARAVLEAAQSTSEGAEAADILWHTALAAEFGDSADARRALEIAQRALSEAIARGADQNEIDRLTAALDRAMQQYLAALAQEALRNNQFAEEDIVEEQSALSQQDLQQLLEDVRQLAAEGRTQEAQALLAMLAGLMDNLEVRISAAASESGERNRELDQAIEGLSGAMAEQRALRDDTARESRENEGRGGELAERQQALEEALQAGREQTQGRRGAGSEAFEEADRALDEAGQAMREAREALERGAMEEALRRQDQALGALRSGADQLAQEQLRRDRAREGQAGRENDGGPRDPLGRAAGGDGQIGVPDQIDSQRAREIRDELRRRAQDPRRPEVEREYLRRLLERFEGA